MGGHHEADRGAALHIAVLTELAETGDYSKYGTLRKKYKSHRDARLIRLGTMSEPQVRPRANWGAMPHARRIFGTGRTPMNVEANV